MPSSSYELVVLGEDLAALACATQCARRGMRTLVIGRERPARYALGPYKLPVEPLLWPHGAGTAGDRLLDDLRGQLALRRRLREPKVGAQLVAPDLRIDLGRDRLASELDRELAEAAEAWLSRWQGAADAARLLDPLVATDRAFPGVGFFERRRASREARATGVAADAWWRACEGDPGAAVWRRLAAIALRHPAPPPAAIARAIDAWRDGPPALRGDGDAIRELLVEKLATAGGELRSGSVTAAFVARGRIASLTLASGEVIGTGQVVTTRSPRDIATLIGARAPRRLLELAGHTRICGYRYTLNLVLEGAAIPDHMAPLVAVIADAGRPPEGDAAFSLHLGEADDSGRVVATVAAVLPSDGALEPGSELLAERCAALRAGLWRGLSEVMPFFERHLVLAHSPFEPHPPQVPGGRGSYDVPRYLPLEMAPVWSGTNDDQLATTAALGGVGYASGLKNLTFTGDQILPTLGVEGALTAGWGAARLACARAGKKKQYLRDEVVGAGAERT